MLDLLISLSSDDALPLYRQVAAQLREAIMDGRLAPDARLPSGRELAIKHGIARNTVMLAYELLVSEGYLHARHRSGHYVGPNLPTGALAAVHDLRRHTAPGPQLPRSRWGGALPLDRVELPAGESRLSVDFRPFFPGSGEARALLFPAEKWRHHLTRCLEREPHAALQYGEPAGYRPLRQAVATHMARARGVVCNPEQVIITTGTHQSLDLLLRTVLDPGDAAAIEDPGYPTGLQALKALGARIVPVPVDEDAMQVDCLARHQGVRLVLVSPSCQFPTGATLQLPRRLALLEWARRTGALMVEDDYNGEFRHDGRPLDGGHQVVYVGGFSRSLAPGIGLGYLVAPPPLMPLLAAAKWLADRQTNTLAQAALAELMSSGDLDRHLHRLRRLFRERRDALLGALDRWVPGAEYRRVPSGLHVYVAFAGIGGATAEATLLQRARQAGVGLWPARPFYMQPPVRAGFLLYFSHLSETQIEEGVRRLAALL